MSAPMPSPLTDEETTLLVMTAQGATLAQVGRHFRITARSAQTRAWQMRAKIGAVSMPHAVHIAHQLGLLDGVA